MPVSLTTILLFGFSLIKQSISEPVPIRVNCGSDDTTTIDGVTWSADRNWIADRDESYSTNSNFNKNTELHKVDRNYWFPGFSYEFTVDSPGTYIVNLYFSEFTDDEIGERVFDIYINGNLVYNNLDIFEEAGGKYIELIKTFEITIGSNNNNNNLINIEFKRDNTGNGRSKCSAIEILFETGSNEIDYYIGCVEKEWDYAPNGDRMAVPGTYNDASELESATWIVETETKIGSKYYKALYRQFTDNTFTTEMNHDTVLGALGPAIRGEVGDTIIVHFKNMCSFPASMHPHGVLYVKGHEGAPYNDEDGINSGDKVEPGGEWIYEWYARTLTIDTHSNAQSSKLWLYHSHVDEINDLHSGLIGPIIITAKGYKTSNDNFKPYDVDRELITFFMLYDENSSNLYNLNAGKVSNLIEDEAWEESNLMHSINGYLFGNLQLNIKNGEKVRWYIGDFGNELDSPHTPHWHGNLLIDSNGNTLDVTELLSGSAKTLDMYVDASGSWLYHCHVFDHIAAGMITTYTVEE